MTGYLRKARRIQSPCPPSTAGRCSHVTVLCPARSRVGPRHLLWPGALSSHSHPPGHRPVREAEPHGGTAPSSLSGRFPSECSPCRLPLQATRAASTPSRIASPMVTATGRPSRQPVGMDWRGRPMASTPCGPMAIMALVHLYLPQVSLSCLPPSHSCAVCFAHVGMENPGRGEGCTQPRWNRAQSTGPGPSKRRDCAVSDHVAEQALGTEIPRSASGLRSSWKLQGLGRMGGTSQRGDWYPVPRPFGQLWACSRGWRDGHQGTAEHTQTCGSSACEPVCPCSHTHAPRCAHVFLLHVFVGRVCVGTCMHVRVGPARVLPGSVSALCV